MICYLFCRFGNGFYLIACVWLEVLKSRSMVHSYILLFNVQLKEVHLCHMFSLQYNCVVMRLYFLLK